MKIEYLPGGRFMIDSSHYFKEAIKEFGEKLTTATTLSKKNIFDVDTSSPKVSEKQKKYFTGWYIKCDTAHHVAEKIYNQPSLSSQRTLCFVW